MNLSAVIKPSLQLLPSLHSVTRNLCRNLVSWTQHPEAGKNTLLGISKPMCNPNVSLIPNPINVISSCGMKQKGKLALRCKDCSYYRKDGRLYVFCDTHPRHKQMSMVTRKKYTWILTHACQGKQRAY